MPSEKEFIILIPKIYKWNTENLGLFFFVKAQQQIFPTVSIDLSIKNYFRFIEIDVDDWDLECAKSTYTRLQHEFYECYETPKKIE